MIALRLHQVAPGNLTGAPRDERVQAAAKGLLADDDHAVHRLGRDRLASAEGAHRVV